MSLTPMIDVVFLLLIFFMLASRFGGDQVLALSGGGAGSGAAWDGPPRLVRIEPQALHLNGAEIAADGLIAALTPLMPAPDAPVILRAGEGVPLQRLVFVIDTLRGAGIPNLILIE
ncbi:MAG: biopolymer transporter ExbD [Paracoccus sp. (in: a-proteobacteria)]|nr:biopolymer transporter ExbD [Paracoccus sp. (in: a-proteobacteria)]